MVDPTLEAIRAATAEHHLALETRLDAVARLATAEGQRMLLPRYLAYHGGSERAVETLLLPVAGLDFTARRRAPLIAEDMSRLGLLPAEAEIGVVTPAASVGEALGRMYVLEGSTLGGRYVLRRLGTLGVDTAALGFLDPYRVETGSRWRDFLLVLSRETGKSLDARQAAVEGAIDAFALAEAILCAPESSVAPCEP